MNENIEQTCGQDRSYRRIEGLFSQTWQESARVNPETFSQNQGNLKFKGFSKATIRQRPYRDEYTGSLPNSEVNRRRARSVLGWGTAWEALWVLLAFLRLSGFLWIFL